MNTGIETRNGFRHRERLLSRKQLTDVMDEAVPAVIQHAELIAAIQKKIFDQGEQLEKLNARVEMDMKARYRLYRSIGCTRLAAFWRAL